MSLGLGTSLLIAPNVRFLIVPAILLIHGLLLGLIATVNAPMFDEIAHVPAGLAHWEFASFDLYRVNPPLIRMIATMPLLAINPRTDWSMFSADPFARPEFSIGSTFLEINGTESFWYFTVCRWSLIPISIFGGWICYRWSKELFGFSSGVVALLLWCFCPNILGWGSVITPDVGAAAFGVWAGYSFWRWLKAPAWIEAFHCGIALGIAELSKSTWIVLFCLWPILWLISRFDSRHRLAFKLSACQLIVILLFGIYILNLGYGFEGSCQQLGKFEFISRALGGKRPIGTTGNLFRDSLVGAIPVPVPANYLKGIDVQKYEFEVGKWSYLLGEQKLGGWYYYYLYALLIKTSLGVLFLGGLASYASVRWKEYSVSVFDRCVLLLPALAVLVLVSSQTGFNRYIRYVLPAVPFLYIFASGIGKAFELRHSSMQRACVLALTIALLGSLSVFPHSMSYFSIVAGGPLGGPAHLLDANIDWGQDLLELKRFVDRHPEVSPIGLTYFGFMDSKLANFACRTIPPSSRKWPRDIPSDLLPGWYAVSVNHLFGYRHSNSDEPQFTYFQQFDPTTTVGYSIYIYHITDEVLAKSKGIVNSRSFD